MRIGLGHAPPGQRDPPGEQVRLRRLAAPDGVQAAGHILGVPEQGGGVIV